MRNSFFYVVLLMVSSLRLSGQNEALKSVVQDYFQYIKLRSNPPERSKIPVYEQKINSLFTKQNKGSHCIDLPEQGAEDDGRSAELNEYYLFYLKYNIEVSFSTPDFFENCKAPEGDSVIAAIVRVKKTLKYKGQTYERLQLITLDKIDNSYKINSVMLLELSKNISNACIKDNAEVQLLLAEKYKSCMQTADQDFAAKNYFFAKKSYELALNMSPNDKTALTQLAACEQKLKSEATIQATITQLMSKGENAFALEKYTLAKDYYDAVVKLNINYGPAHMKWRECNDKLKEQQERQNQQNCEQYLRLGDEYFNNGAFETAKIYYEFIVVNNCANKVTANAKITEINNRLQENTYVQRAEAEIQQAKNYIRQGGRANVIKGLEGLLKYENLDGEACHLIAQAYIDFPSILSNKGYDASQINEVVLNYAQMAQSKGYGHLYQQLLQEEEQARAAEKRRQAEDRRAKEVPVKPYRPYKPWDYRFTVGVGASFGRINFMNVTNGLSPQTNYSTYLSMPIESYSRNYRLGLYVEAALSYYGFQVVQGRFTDSFAVTNLEVPIYLRIGFGESNYDFVGIGAAYNKTDKVVWTDLDGGSDDNINQVVKSYWSVVGNLRYGWKHGALMFKVKYDLSDIFNKDYHLRLLQTIPDNNFSLRLLTTSLGFIIML